MEVIGTVSAVVALTETTGKLAKGLKELASRWSNAPEEVKALSDTADQLAIKFTLVKETIDDSGNALLDDVIRQGLMQLVAEAKAATGNLEILHKKLEECGSTFQRTRWAVKDARAARNISSTVKDIEERLSKWIDCISLKGHITAVRRLDETRRMMLFEFGEVKQMLSAVAISSSDTGASRSPSSMQSLATLQRSVPQLERGNVPTAAIRRVFEGKPWEVGERWRSWGLQGTVIKSTHGQNTDYDVVFNIPLPLAWLFGSLALRGQLGFRVPLRQNTLTLRHPSYFTVARIVGEYHPFLVACWDGDLDTVRTMLRNGDGRPTDRTANGGSPMFFAIMNCNLNIVAELLENGVDIDDGTLDSRQSTALEIAVAHGQIDIMRLLLNHGASQDHSDLYGWTPSSRCWVSQTHASTPAIDMFNILGEYALQDKNSMGGSMGQLHAAALYSGAAEIHYLIRLGLATTDKSLAGLNPLHYAVAAGNSAAYFALLSYHAVANGIGNYGYPLLHAAIVGTGHWGQDLNGWAGLMNQETIIRDLLDRGVDPATTNAPDKDWNFPESVQGLSITAQQLAAACGPETEAWYMSILRDCGFLEAEEDIARLQDLETRDTFQGGHVIGEWEPVSEYDSDQESVYDDRPSQDYGSDLEVRLGSEYDSDPGSVYEDGVVEYDESDLEEDDLFWDAEQGY